MRRRLILCMVAIGLASASAGWTIGAGTTATREGGTFRVALCFGGGNPCFDYLDPALEDSAVTPTFCASLMRYPDKPPPAGYRLVPELARSFPRISQDGRTYTFRLRQAVRFSNGAVVTGRDLAHSLDRILDPALQSPRSGSFANIVGARAVLKGRAKTPSGVKATRTAITFRLMHPEGAFLDDLASLCVVPSGLPANPEGVGAPLPSAGPYYPSQYVPGRRIVLERNRFYRGPRPHHVTRFDVD